MQVIIFVAISITILWTGGIDCVKVTDDHLDRAKKGKWVYFTIDGVEHGIKIITKSFLSVEDLEMECQKDGAHAASVHSQEENDFIYDVVEGAFAGKQRNEEGTYIRIGYLWRWTGVRWYDGTDVDFEGFTGDTEKESPLCEVKPNVKGYCGNIFMGYPKNIRNDWCMTPCDESKGSIYGVCAVRAD